MGTKNKEELKESLAASKEELATAKEELRGFEKTNDLKKGEDHSQNKKLGKAWKKLNAMVVKKTAEVEAAREALKGAKSETTRRATVHTYPADVVTAADKKKYRAKVRAERKRAEKAAEKGETTETKKGSKKEEGKKEGGKKKGGNKAKQKETEGED